MSRLWSSPLSSFLILAIIWVAFSAVLEVRRVQRHKATVEDVALMKAESDYMVTLYYRSWNARHGGVYAPVTEDSPVNPYLEVEDKVVTFPSGRDYTMINPAYMTRQVHELMEADGILSARMTSLMPINPANAPVGWERDALQSFEQGNERYHVMENDADGAPVLHFMRPLHVEASCLQCHAQQGYREGEVRGGLALTIPLTPIRETLIEDEAASRILHTGSMAFGLAIIFGLAWQSQRQHRREHRLRGELDQQNQRIRRINDDVPGLIYEFRRDPAGKYSFAFASDYLQRLFGVATADAVNDASPVFARIHPDDVRNVTNSIEISYNNCTPWQQTFRARSNDGDYRWLYGNSIIEMQPDGTALWHGFLTDITSQKEIQQRLTEARDAAEASSRAKSEFLAMMSHEIRTPMNGILPVIEMLQQRSTDPQDQRLLDIVNQSAQSLLHVINDILDYSKLKSGRISIETVPFEPRRLLAQAVENIQPAAQSKGIRIQQDIAANVPQVVSGDPNRIRQILLNLLSNAVKFSTDGSIDVCISCAQPEWLSFHVEDRGPGMSAEVIERLFQPFEQGDSSITRKFGGTGLGLSICKLLVDAMHGSIRIQSTVGHGSCFSFDLPLPATAAPEPDQSSAASQSVPPPAQRNHMQLHALLAEDDATNQEVLQSIMNRFGMTSDTCSRGDHAVEAAATGDYDVILMDVQMPHMDGLTAIRQIRSMQLAKRPVIIGVTAHAMQSDRASVLEAGADAFITKPVRIHQLKECLAGFFPLT
jgi:signal transduction histidine kinase